MPGWGTLGGAAKLLPTEMSPLATSNGPGVMCQTITFDCGVTDGSCAATM